MNQSVIETPPKACNWCGLELGPGQAHLTRDTCINSLQLSYSAAVRTVANLDAQNQSLKMTARIAWILINRAIDKTVIVTEAELKGMPAGARAKATPQDDHTLKVEAVVRQQEGVA